MGDSSGIRAGRAFVELGTDDNKLTAGLRKAQQRLRAFSAGINQIGAPIAKIGVAITGSLLGAAKVFSTFGDNIAKMAIRTGLSTEAVSELGFAADRSGTDIAALETGIRKMQKVLGEAEGGSVSAAESLDRLGLSVADLKGLNPEQAFKLIADRLDLISDPTLKAAAAMEIFGKSGTSLVPLMQGGSAAINQLQREAKSLGQTMSAETAADAEKLNDSLGDVMSTIRAVTVSIGVALAPVLTEYSNRIAASLASASRWVSQHKELINVALQVGLTAAAAGASLVALGTGFNVLAASAGGVVTVIKAVNTALTFLAANPAVIGITAIAAATVALNIAQVQLSTTTAQTADQFERLLSTGDELRAQEQSRIQRLQALAQKQELTSREMKEAKSIAASLGEELGHLTSIDVKFDDLTSTVLASADAFKKLEAAMRFQATAQLEQSISETKKNIRELGDEIGNVTTRTKLNPLTSEQSRVDEINSLVQRREEQFKKLQGMNKRLKAVTGGDTSAATTPSATAGGSGSAGIPDLDDSGGGSGDSVIKRIHDLKLQQIADEHERATTSIDDRYAEELSQAQRAGATKQALARIEEAHQLELANLNSQHNKDQAAQQLRDAAEIESIKIQSIEDEHAQAVASIESRHKLNMNLAKLEGDTVKQAHLEAIRLAELATENAREQLRLEQQAAQAAMGDKKRQQSIEELSLQNRFEGVALEREMLALEKKRAIEEAKKNGQSVSLVEQEFALKEQLLNKKSESGVSHSVAGTFGGMMAGQLGTGQLGEQLASAKTGMNQAMQGASQQGGKNASGASSGDKSDKQIGLLEQIADNTKRLLDKKSGLVYE